jgi:hypothetical protein
MPGQPVSGHSRKPGQRCRHARPARPAPPPPAAPAAQSSPLPLVSSGTARSTGRRRTPATPVRQAGPPDPRPGHRRRRRYCRRTPAAAGGCAASVEILRGGLGAWCSAGGCAYCHDRCSCRGAAGSAVGDVAPTRLPGSPCAIVESRHLPGPSDAACCYRPAGLRWSARTCAGVRVRCRSRHEIHWRPISVASSATTTRMPVPWSRSRPGSGPAGSTTWRYPYCRFSAEELLALLADHLQPGRHPRRAPRQGRPGRDAHPPGHPARPPPTPPHPARAAADRAACCPDRPRHRQTLAAPRRPPRRHSKSRTQPEAGVPGNGTRRHSQDDAGLWQQEHA